MPKKVCAGKLAKEIQLTFKINPEQLRRMYTSQNSLELADLACSWASEGSSNFREFSEVCVSITY